MDTIDYSGAPVTQGRRDRQADLEQKWTALASELRGITTTYIEPINAWAYERQEPHVKRPDEAN